MAIKTGLFGLGKIGALYALDPVMAKQVEFASHLQVIEAHDDFELILAVDPDAKTRAAVGEHWPDVTPVAGLNEADNLAAVEVAVLATPPQARLDILDALTNVRAVFVEKPIGFDLPESEAFLQACARRNIDVQVNFWRRGDELFNRLAQGDLHEAIGDPQAVFGVYGNGMHNNAAHAIDFVEMLLGEIVEVAAIGPSRERARNPISGDVDQGFAVTTAGGVTASFLPVDFDHYREISFDFWGTRGRLEMVQESAVIRVSSVAPHRGESGSNEVACDDVRLLSPTCGSALMNMYENLARSLAGDGSMCSPGANALKVERVLDAIEQSARDKCAVSLSGTGK